MPAIHAAESSTAVIASPAKSGAGDSAVARVTSDASGGPFASVLARQVAQGDARPASVNTADTAPPATTPDDGTQTALLPLFGSSDQLSSLYAAFFDNGDPNGEQGTIAGQVSGDLLSLVATIPITVANTTGDLNATDKSGNAALLSAATVTLDSDARTTEANSKLSGLGLSVPDSRRALANMSDEVVFGQSGTAKSPAIVAASSDLTSAAADKLVARMGLESGTTPRGDGILTATGLMPTNSANQANPSTDIRIAVPIGTGRWESAIGNSLVFMTGNGREHAELVLTPPQLGRIDVSVSVNGDQASAFFVSANPAVREALENAMPRLKEIFADAGITLGQAQVGSESPRQSASNRENNDNPLHGGVPEVGGDHGTQPVGTQGSALRQIAARGLVDTFV